MNPRLYLIGRYFSAKFNGTSDDIAVHFPVYFQVAGKFHVHSFAKPITAQYLQTIHNFRELTHTSSGISAVVTCSFLTLFCIRFIKIKYLVWGAATVMFSLFMITTLVAKMPVEFEGSGTIIR